MRGKLYIDGQDAFTEYGIFIAEGGYEGLVEWPALKAPDHNDWPEEDGIDTDLLSPQLASKEFDINFGCMDAGKTIRLFQTLTDGAYHTFRFAELGIERQLRLISQNNVTTFMPLQRFALKFADDAPLDGYEYEDPLSLPGVIAQGYVIDNRDLAEYGVAVVEGTLDSVLAAPSVKGNLKMESQAVGGLIYDDTAVCFQSKDITLSCVLRAPDKGSFWRNYNALLSDLMQPYERMFSVEELDEYYTCFYKSSSVGSFNIVRGESVWCEFSITLTLLSARPGHEEFLLSTEDEKVITTQESTDEYNEFIEMKAYED